MLSLSQEGSFDRGGAFYPGWLLTGWQKTGAIDRGAFDRLILTKVFNTTVFYAKLYTFYRLLPRSVYPVVDILYWYMLWQLSVINFAVKKIQSD